MNKNFVIEYFDVVLFHETKAKKKEKGKRRQKQETKRKQERKTRRKEERKEKDRDRERESEKGGGQKRLGRKKGKHLKINKKCPFSGGKQGFSMKNKERNQQKNKKTKKTNKEGLGPSEVARNKKTKQKTFRAK